MGRLSAIKVQLELEYFQIWAIQMQFVNEIFSPQEGIFM